MQISVLGPVEVSVDGRPVAIGPGKPRALLTLLALHEGTTVSTGRLVEGLWGDEPPPTAHKMVQVYVSQLRKTLAAGGDGAEIVTRGRGYELRLGNGGLDSERFEHLITEGMPREALDLWRGAPLGDVADEPFALGEIRRLEELRLRAIELAVDDDLADGRHREVIGEIEAVAAEEPLREHLHAQRMLALYRSGRQADALEAYSDYRHSLVEAIGAEPGPDLRRLHEAVLRQDPELALPGDAAPELPPELDAGTALVGRDAELDALREQWRHAHAGVGRLVVIAGEPGIGKTRLAAELALELHRDRVAVLFASGAGAPAAATEVLATARAARRPTLVVLDDLDRAGDESAPRSTRSARSSRAFRSSSSPSATPASTLTRRCPSARSLPTRWRRSLAAAGTPTSTSSSSSRPRAACRSGSTASRPSGRGPRPPAARRPSAPA